MTLAAHLLFWYRLHGRILPWRGTQNAYRILVSEIMLQQTQVSRGILFYEKWLKEFPDWDSLARATNADVIRAWAGLGYNRRALMLRDVAREVMRTGEPKSEADWRRLKGIGPYTAAALAAFALHERVLPIDTNIRRVLNRALLGIPFPDPEKDEQLKILAERFLPKKGNYFDIPQALFDLATAICTKTPDCSSCPLRNECCASEQFLQKKIQAPKQMIKKAAEKIHPGKKYPDRIYRGRILKTVREEQIIPVDKLGKKIDPSFKKTDIPWLKSMVSRLIRDGFLEENKGKLRLSQTD
ncbi:MAG TPA: A/G-specific adenine glycosylase [Patescibacteria group bacterium]|nr:A/G-specific adenine glycosylase [Patescibacteria group bacterium]